LRTSDGRISFALLASVLTLTARAETYEFKLEVDAQGKTACTHLKLPSKDAPTDKVVVTLDRGLATQSLEIYAPAAGRDTPFAKDAAGTEWSIAKNKLEAIASFQLREDPDQKKAGQLACEETRLPAPTKTTTSTGAATPAEVDTGMVSWWQTDGRRALDDLKSGWARAVAGPRFRYDIHFLVHYANGEPAPPYPESVPEGQPIQVVVIVEQGVPLQASLTVNSCEGLQPFRVKEAAAAPGGRPEAGVKKREFLLVAFGRTLACGAGTLSYTLKLNEVDHVQSLRVRPVYHLAVTAAYGFDFTRVPSFSAPNGTILKTADRAGLGLRLGFTWFPWGIDYEDMQWFNWFTNFVFAVDPNAPTENFLTGVALTPTGGLSLLVGMNLRRVTVLRGMAVGAPFPGPGDIPTDKVWSNESIGLYLGLSVDDDLFKAMKGRLGAP